MVLSISGPSSTGKTTLINKLKELYPQYNYIDEFFREIVKEQISFDDPERSFLFQCDLCLKMPSPIFNINFVYIMDRCAYDYIVYTSLHFYRLPDELKKQYISKYVESILYCRYLLRNVNCIFLTHTDDRSIENDNFRPTIYNELRAEEINLFSTLIDSVNKKYCFLPNDIDNQIFTIENFIKREL